MLNNDSFPKGGFTTYLRQQYSPVPESEEERIMEAVIELLDKSQGPFDSTVSFLEQAARMIHRRFEFSRIAIGLKDRTDDLFRYKVFIGFTGSAEQAHRKMAYTQKDMLDDVKFPALKLSRTTEFLRESQAEGERELYNRPSELGKERRDKKEFKEGDYFDIFMYGDKHEMIGWFELSRTKNDLLPPRRTIKWLELIAKIVARVIWDREYSPRNQPR